MLYFDALLTRIRHVDIYGGVRVPRARGREREKERERERGARERASERASERERAREREGGREWGRVSDECIGDDEWIRYDCRNESLVHPMTSH
jgi:hypothetical protein